jgi:hypothetical protein
MLQAASGEGLVIQVSALVSSVSGSLRQGPGRTFTSCSMFHARRTPSASARWGGRRAQRR